MAFGDIDFLDDDPQPELAVTCLPECIQAVVAGTDATLFRSDIGVNMAVSIVFV